MFSSWLRMMQGDGLDIFVGLLLLGICVLVIGLFIYLVGMMINHFFAKRESAEGIIKKAFWRKAYSTTTMVNSGNNVMIPITTTHPATWNYEIAVKEQLCSFSTEDTGTYKPLEVNAKITANYLISLFSDKYQIQTIDR